MNFRIIAIITLLFLIVFKQLYIPSFTDDDAFFYDISYHLLNEGKNILDTYGSGLGHDRFVASVPVFFSIFTSISVLAVQITGRVEFVHLSSLLLIIIVTMLLYKEMLKHSEKSFWIIIILLLISDGIIANRFLSLRYDGYLVVIMAFLYIAMKKCIVFDNYKNYLILALWVIIAALSHWQMAFTIFAVLVCLGFSNVMGKKLPRIELFTLALLVFILYSGYLGYLIIDDERWQSFILQMIESKKMSGSPQHLAPVKMIKIFFGNVFYANSINSVLSLSLVVFVLISLKVFIYKIRGIIVYEEKSDKNDGNIEGRRSDHFENLVIDCIFIAAAIVPSLSLYYVGPRFIPLYIVIIIILKGYADFFNKNNLNLEIIIRISLMLNYLGYFLLSKYYFHTKGAGLYVNYSLYLVCIYFIFYFIKNRIGTKQAVAVSAVLLLSLNILLNVIPFQLLTTGRSPASHSGVSEIKANIVKIIPDLFYSDGDTNSMKKEIVVFCDPVLHYLPLRTLTSGNRLKLHSLFPLLYFKSVNFQQSYMNDFNPEYVLMSANDSDQLDNSGSIGRELKDKIALNYVKLGNIDLLYAKTTIYKRKFSL